MNSFCRGIGYSDSGEPWATRCYNVGVGDTSEGGWFPDTCDCEGVNSISDLYGACPCACDCGECSGGDPWGDSNWDDYDWNDWDFVNTDWDYIDGSTWEPSPGGWDWPDDDPGDWPDPNLSATAYPSDYPDYDPSWNSDIQIKWLDGMNKLYEILSGEE